MCPPVPLPYWLDSLELTTLSVCATFATLYVVRRSGEPWERFGVTRLRLWDFLFFGPLLLLAAETLWRLQCEVLSGFGVVQFEELFAPPTQPVDYGLMAIKHSANALAEEVITRAYLITRFESLLRSRAAAVIVSAALFASYHVYQGAAGLINAMVIGVVFGATYLLLRRIWPLVIGHALYNIRIELAV